ncbi:RNA polymerase II transcriptional coactivator [Mycena kentingensis (nom. inval.)]|nr:RNA polymerase II transcriptional coactivator [Mycena kentingensis (nom. inval.)]
MPPKRQGRHRRRPEAAFKGTLHPLPQSSKLNCQQKVKKEAEESAKPRSAAKKVKKEQEESAPKSRSSKKSEEGDEEEAAPRTVKKPHFSDSEDDTPEVKTNDTGEKYIELGTKGHKRVTVRSFKGSTLIDIREFYVDKARPIVQHMLTTDQPTRLQATDEIKPGKKGIALSVEQYNALKGVIGLVDELVEDLDK